MMKQFLLAMWLSMGFVLPASAHFAFLLPDGADKGKAVFSDALKPDAQGVPVEKLAKTKLQCLVEGQLQDVKWTHDAKANCYTFDVPGKGTRIVFGTTDYGVFQRGEGKPMWLKYYPKGVFGPLPTAEQATLGNKVPIEIVPLVDGGKLRFKVLAQGKPLAKSDVTLLVPGESKSIAVTTDADGMTESYEKAGSYGVVAKFTESQAGEQGGQKYEEVRHYATLTVNWSK